jgi:sec-independent protein translocase protein TatC
VKEKNLTLIGHLSELRKRITIIALAFIITSTVSYFYVEPLIESIIKLAPSLEFIYVAPAELLLAYVKISIIAGLTISAPIIFWQIWAFVKPGLIKQEKKYILISLIGGSFFFIAGLIFAYFVVLPFMLQFFANLQTKDIKPMISFGNYVGFITTILLCFGLVFETPILMILLTRFGIIKVKFFTENRKYIILIIFVVAAVVTPPDIISQILLAVPMILLFEIGIILSKLALRKKAKQAALEE